MGALRAERVSDDRYQLGEGVLWDAEGRRLRWVDILRGEVYSAALEGPEFLPRADLTLDCPVSAVVPIAGGGLLLAAGTRLARLAPDGRVRWGPSFLRGEGRRSNDGACDAEGRFFVGSVTDGRILDDEGLYRSVEGGSPRAVRRDLHHTNGLDWSPDGARMYLVDSVPGDVWAADYDLRSGEPTGWRIAFRVQDGLPDGLMVDAEGALWIAVWGAGEVRRYSSGGRLLATVEVPTPFVTSLALAGADGRTMYITTAQGDADGPDAGAIFTARVEVPGRPANRAAGAGF
ncbi:SMP-30/gluconolactonase/LRE family protein [Amnibacterium sp. CER49]|uniref:SMP-30/gluconolactonase/LRE family protein n=1 Tax=Amnibacterium sp. CER49 TaxID=3039161 RepID=UPI002448A273|nr:SMP-30/gluconolactonase/LRE family protein [Amnibacterium sp. CER49]MDH2443341.1 SMP-30/gluconolactonase/LRE family protein [Amnibacterium sp. CER49]